MLDQPRPVWLTLDEYALSNDALAQLARKRWQAAPADPVNAVIDALSLAYPNQVWIDRFSDDAVTMLRALRIPEPTDA